MKDSVLLMKKQYNLWVILSVLEEYMKVSGIKADHKIEETKTCICNTARIRGKLVTIYKGAPDTNF